MPATRTLKKIIEERIEEAGGLLPFDAFMRAALYEPGLGYYESEKIFGADGDFVTAPDLGPWLSFGLYDLVTWGCQQFGDAPGWTLMEQGSGSGRLLLALLKLLSEHPELMPAQVISVEQSPRLRRMQQELFSEHGFNVELMASLDDVAPLKHVIAFSNELPDAFPVRCFRWRQGHFYERGVALADDGFCWRDVETPMEDAPEIAGALVAAWPEDYCSEWNPSLAVWQSQLAGVIQSGFVFCIDYGYSRQEYYRPGRIEGSLLAHTRHQTSEDVLAHVGEQDITAHVDFSALAEAGRIAGLEPLAWMTQGGWLAQSPSVQAFVQSLARQSDAESMHLMAHAKRLLMPFGMGEMFKLLLQSRGVSVEKPPYLQQFDHLQQL